MKSPIIVLFSIVIILLSRDFVHAQTLDSLKAEVQRATGAKKAELQYLIAAQLRTIDPKRAQQLIDSSLHYSIQENDHSIEVMALLTQASLYSFQSDLLNAEQILNKALDLAERTSNREALEKGELTLGTILIRLEKFDEALVIHIQGLKRTRAKRNPDLEVSHLTNIGVIKQYVKDLDGAENYLKEALEISEANGFLLRVAQLNGNLGIVEFNRRNLALSAQYHEKSLSVFQELGDKQHMAISLSNLGTVYSSLKNYTRALDYYDKSIALRKELKDRRGIGTVIRNQGRSAYNQGKYDKALELLEEALEIGKEYRNHRNLSEIYHLISQSYERSNLAKSLDYYKLYTAEQDTMRQLANEKEVKKLARKYDFESLQSENTIQRQQNEIQTLAISHRNKVIVLIVIIFLLLLLFFLVNYRVVKNKLILSQKDQHIAEQEMIIRAEQFAKETDQLVSYANELLRKNEQLTTKSEELELLRKGGFENQSKEIIDKMHKAIHNDKDWMAFNLYFEKIYPDFIAAIETDKKVKLTSSEQRLLSLLRINLSNKEIAGLLNISSESVVKAKYRLKQKLGIPDASEFLTFLDTMS